MSWNWHSPGYVIDTASQMPCYLNNLGLKKQRETSCTMIMIQRFVSGPALANIAAVGTSNDAIQFHLDRRLLVFAEILVAARMYGDDLSR